MQELGETQRSKPEVACGRPSMAAIDTLVLDCPLSHCLIIASVVMEGWALVI